MASHVLISTRIHSPYAGPHFRFGRHNIREAPLLRELF